MKSLVVFVFEESEGGKDPPDDDAVSELPVTACPSQFLEGANECFGIDDDHVCDVGVVDSFPKGVGGYQPSMMLVCCISPFHEDALLGVRIEASMVGGNGEKLCNVAREFDGCGVYEDSLGLEELYVVEVIAEHAE